MLSPRPTVEHPPESHGQSQDSVFTLQMHHQFQTWRHGCLCRGKARFLHHYSETHQSYKLSCSGPEIPSGNQLFDILRLGPRNFRMIVLEDSDPYSPYHTWEKPLKHSDEFMRIPGVPGRVSALTWNNIWSHKKHCGKYTHVQMKCVQMLCLLPLKVWHLHFRSWTFSSPWTSKVVDDFPHRNFLTPTLAHFLLRAWVLGEEIRFIKRISKL